MAYFANGTEGQVFDEQCFVCKYGEKPCPIALIQMEFNYDAYKNKIATDILNYLVENNGTCAMFAVFREDFEIDLTEEKIIAERYGKLIELDRARAI
jgi:hypothetical protein